MNGDVVILEGPRSGAIYIQDIADGIEDVPQDLRDEVHDAYIQALKDNDGDPPEFFEVLSYTGEWMDERVIEEAIYQGAFDNMILDDEEESEIISEYYDYMSYCGYYSLLENIVFEILKLSEYNFKVEDYDGDIVHNEAQQNIFNLASLEGSGLIRLN